MLALDPRHKYRQKTIQALFAYRAGNPHPSTRISKKVIQAIGQIDPLIKRAAPKWPLSQINWIDLAILRLACFELLFQPDTPSKVVINEAIELAKDFSNQNSASFVNAVLGTVLKQNDRKS